MIYGNLQYFSQIAAVVLACVRLGFFFQTGHNNLDEYLNIRAAVMVGDAAEFTISALQRQQGSWAASL